MTEELHPNADAAELEIYREHLLDRYRTPRHAGRPESFTFGHRELNASCGDVCEVFLRMNEDGKVAEARFEGHGCAVSMAGADLLMEWSVGKSVPEISALSVEEMIGILGVPVSPSRLKCATLGLKTLQASVIEPKS